MSPGPPGSVGSSASFFALSIRALCAKKYALSRMKTKTMKRVVRKAVRRVSTPSGAMTEWMDLPATVAIIPLRNVKSRLTQFAGERHDCKDMAIFKVDTILLTQRKFTTSIPIKGGLAKQVYKT